MRSTHESSPREGGYQDAFVPNSDHPGANSNHAGLLPSHNEKVHRADSALFRVDTAGESGRSGIHPLWFLKVCFKSTCTLSMLVNVLWPFVPPAIVLHFVRPDLHVWVFALNYIAMVPSANLLGFAGGELAKKLPKVLGVLLETTLSSVVEIVLFMVLIKNDAFVVIQAAILGSILANLLLCLGLCFFLGGFGRGEQIFHEAVSEVGSGLLLVAGFGLLIPSAFNAAVLSKANAPLSEALLNEYTLTISRATAVLLLVAFLMWVYTCCNPCRGICC